MKKKKLGLFVIIIVLVIGAAGLYMSSQNASKLKLLDDSLDEAFARFTTDPVNGLACESTEIINLSLADLSELKAMSFVETKLPEGAKEIYQFTDDNIYLYILSDGENMYLATNSYELNTGGDAFYTPLFDGYEHVYTSDALVNWVNHLELATPDA